MKGYFIETTTQTYCCGRMTEFKNVLRSRNDPSERRDFCFEISLESESGSHLATAKGSRYLQEH